MVIILCRWLPRQLWQFREPKVRRDRVFIDQKGIRYRRPHWSMSLLLTTQNPVCTENRSRLTYSVLSTQCSVLDGLTNDCCCCGRLVCCVFVGSFLLIWETTWPNISPWAPGLLCRVHLPIAISTWAYILYLPLYAGRMVRQPLWLLMAVFISSFNVRVGNFVCDR